MFGDFFGLVAAVAIIAIIVVMTRQNTRIQLMEREIGALRSLVLDSLAGAARPAPQPGSDGVTAEAAWGFDPARTDAAAILSPVEEIQLPAQPIPSLEALDAAGPWEPASAAPQPAAAPRAQAVRPDIETALGTRWAVWVGGIAIALGAVFLIRYSIEAGFFGPGLRLTLAALLGLVLVVGGEFIRRTGFVLPVEGIQGAYVPGILTAAGAFTLFGTVYAAHALYGFIGPSVAFVLLGAIGIAAISASLLHGQAIAGIGLLGSLVTPMLVASEAPNAWALFVYLAVVLVATIAIARLRDWLALAAAGFTGAGLWALVYVVGSPVVDMAVVLFISAVVLASLAFVWLRGPQDEGIDRVSAAPAATGALVAIACFANPALQASGGVWTATALIVAMGAVALYRNPALPLLHGAAAATLLLYLRTGLSGSFELEFGAGSIAIDGSAPVAEGRPVILAGIILGAFFLASGLWSARRFATAQPVRPASWAAAAVVVPNVVLAMLWISFGNVDVDIVHALVALLLGSALAAGGEWAARAEAPPLAGGPSVSLALAGAGAALVLALHMGFGSGFTTVLVGLAAALPALATRARAYPVLGWLSLGAAIVVLARAAFDPTIVGAGQLGTTPVLNWLLPGYGIPALAFGFAAWQLARTTDGRPRLAMEAAAALFALLTVAMLVRHAMNGGIIVSTEPTLAEQSIYTLIGLGAGAILIAIDRRSPSPVMRFGSLAAGVLSAAMALLTHVLVLNPVFTGESTGTIPVFNLILLAYLLPALAAGALAHYARGKRPQWYSAMLGLLAAVLAFVYATLSVRRLFWGEFIGGWRGLDQLENYTYSALWLALGVVMLVIGVRMRSQVLRIASAVLIALAVAKVFLFDMSELEGVLRALSFLGLGAVLIGIGLFYQRLLAADRRAERALEGGGATS